MTLKRHEKDCPEKPIIRPSHMNNVTNRVAAMMKKAEKEELKPKVRMGNSELKNAFDFT